MPRPWAAALAPAAWAYRGGLAVREAAYRLGLLSTTRLPCRVVSVGNLTVGGTGKTPLVEAIARELSARGRRVVILSRGYGRRRRHGVDLVSDGARLLLSARDAGDEAVLLGRRLPGVPVVVGPDRARAGAWALSRFAPDVLLLDDGFQHRRLAKDVEVVCLDALAPWGRGGLLPRGSLREPPAALARAHLIVLTGVEAAPDLSGVLGDVRRWTGAARVAVAWREAEAAEELYSGTASPPGTLAGRSLLAFAGIAVPESFRATLAALGIVPRDFVAFPDHHAYDPADLLGLERRARAALAEGLVTTEKDAVRLPGTGSMPVWVLRIRLRLRDADAAWWATLDPR